MPESMRVTLELGPKGKRIAAVAPDWPGLERGGRSEEAALEALRAYLPRYTPVAAFADESESFARFAGPLDVVERYSGTGSTDFWGISFAFSSIDREAISRDELERQLRLLQACWTFFDGVRSRVSPEMRKGPRGGGRERDHIVRHTLGVEQDWAQRLGVGIPLDAMLTPDGLREHREASCDAVRALHAEGRLAGNWPLRFLIRHTAFHTMDHAWEMEDKDLTVAASR